MAKSKGAKRDPHKERFWRRTIKQHQQSGLSIRDFCREHGISEPSFYGWRRELQNRYQRESSSCPAGLTEKPEPNAEPSVATFLPVRLVADAEVPPARIEVVVNETTVVRVLPGFDPKTLDQILATLRERPC